MRKAPDSNTDHITRSKSCYSCAIKAGDGKRDFRRPDCQGHRPWTHAPPRMQPTLKGFYKRLTTSMPSATSRSGIEAAWCHPLRVAGELGGWFQGRCPWLSSSAPLGRDRKGVITGAAWRGQSNILTLFLCSAGAARRSWWTQPGPATCGGCATVAGAAAGSRIVSKCGT